MTNSVEILNPHPDFANRVTNVKKLRIFCRCAVLAVGAFQAWVTRFTMNPDGVSYLDIGDAYWRGDWHNAISAYWSPLYSWILGFALKVIKPSAFWEYPLVHFVNFVIYAATLACFEYFLVTFIVYRKQEDQDLLKRGLIGLSESAWWLLGYSLFLLSSTVLIGLHLVTPDMCVAGLVFCASGLVVRIRSSSSVASYGTYIALGLVLGFGYLAKAVMFPLAFVFLATAMLAGGHKGRSVSRLVIATVVFAIVGSPLIAAISYQKGRLTFGDAPSWTYSFYVNHVDFWLTNSPILRHPIRQVLLYPPVYEFARPVEGTFPPWYDPPYWKEGIEPHLTLKGEIGPIRNAAVLYALVFLTVFLNALAAVCILYPYDESIRVTIGRLAQSWMITIPAIATFGLYFLVHAETRFVGAQSTLLFIGIFAAITFPVHENKPGLTRLIMIAIAVTSVMISGFVIKKYQWDSQPIYQQAAIALQGVGVQANDRIGLVWNEKWNAGAADGAIIPRLLKLKVIAEVTDADLFWSCDRQTQNAAIAAMGAKGVRFILAYRVPYPTPNGWTRLATTDYYVSLLGSQ